jgi:hypothetical protein
MSQTLHGTVDFRRRHQLRFFYDAHWADILTYGPLLSKSLVNAAATLESRYFHSRRARLPVAMLKFR